MLILSSILGLKSCQVDYTQAFPQAELQDPVFIRIPQGWHVDSSGNLAQNTDPRHNDNSHYLKLKRNLYGIKQAAHNWFNYLWDGLLCLGFCQSQADCCLFWRCDCIILIYVDDCRIFAPSQSTIDQVIAALSNTYNLQDEGDISACLGVQVTKDPNNDTITLTQPGLIGQVIQDVGLTDFSKGEETPADSLLHADKDGAPRHESWNYPSIIGKLNYIANNTRPDISMAVHQCARFCVSPRAIHELAVERVIRYLHTTKKQGIIMHPSANLSLDMYVDSDFAGMWHREHTHLCDNVLSRTGYVIFFGGCPVTWASRLQTEITLSTTENECIALSSTARELLPLCQLLLDIDTNSFISLPKTSPHDSIKGSTLLPSQIFEDNAACIVLVTTSTNFKPRTKHIALKYHHFKDRVTNGSLQIIKVPTDSNIADIFTKPLVRFKFEHLHHMLLGW
jgi:hypothetical protein